MSALAPPLAISGLTLAYGARVAVRDLSLHCQEGSITAVIGPSGVGKSSLLKALNRTLESEGGRVIAGQALLGSEDLLAVKGDLSALRRRVGLLAQRPAAFPFSIERNLTLALGRSWRKAERRRFCEALLHQVGLDTELRGRLDARATDLSGGQQQRLCLARTLALSPQVLLADEPCSALDPLSGAKLEALLVALRKQMTILLVTHHLAQARRIADQVALLWPEPEGARLVECGPTESFFIAPKEELTRRYLSGQIG